MTALISYFLIALLVSFLCSLLESVLLSISLAQVCVMERNSDYKYHGQYRGRSRGWCPDPESIR